MRIYQQSILHRIIWYNSWNQMSLNLNLIPLNNIFRKLCKCYVLETHSLFLFVLVYAEHFVFLLFFQSHFVMNLLNRCQVIIPTLLFTDCPNCLDDSLQTPNRWTMPLLKSGEKRYYLGIFFKVSANFIHFHE